MRLTMARKGSKMENQEIITQTGAETQEGVSPAAESIQDTGAAPESTREGAQGNPAEAPAAESPYRVRYNHEDVDLTREQVLEYAQKGMNYDKVHGELQRLREDPARRMLEREAAEMGVSPEEYLRRTSESGMQADVDRLVSGGYDEREAREIVEGRRAKSRLAELERQRQAEDRRRADLSEFRELFPDVAITDVPQEVWDGVGHGMTLTDAYMRYDRRESIRRARAEAANAANAASAPPAQTPAPETPKNLSREDVARMSREEVRRNYDRILKSMPLWK